MKKIICPNCLSDLSVEHYTISMPDTKVLMYTSRLHCTKCLYKKEPKNLFNPKFSEIAKIILQDEKGGEKKYE